MAPTKRNKTALQDMIDALALKLPNVGPLNQQSATPRTTDADSNTKKSLVEPAESSPSLLGIPPEVRDRIFELALFHHDNAGVICPPITPPNADTTKLSVAGVWRDVRTPDPNHYVPSGGTLLPPDRAGRTAFLQ